MEFYMKKAAQEERRRQPKQSKDEMPPPGSLQVPVKKGHHLGDYVPPEELEKFLSSCNDAAAQKAAREAAEMAKIQADNVGHKLLSKMGWKEKDDSCLTLVIPGRFMATHSVQLVTGQTVRVDGSVRFQGISRMKIELIHWDLVTGWVPLLVRILKRC